MFYRTDILAELGAAVPQTWKDFISLLPAVQQSSMNVGVPDFLTHFYQRGGTLYNEDGSRAQLDGEAAAAAFSAYTKFFTHYKTPYIYDFANRFRTGEMPVGFADFTLFNTLQVFAPEIRGLWSFALVPGIMRDDGTINRSIPTSSVASMMFPNVENPETAWEFLKWWLAADTQVRYGRELESVMGASARYATANLAAFQRLAWNAEEMAVLTAQRQWTVGTPEVPGGYYVTRHLTNASLRVINNLEDPRETLLKYSRTINDELSKKRKEFGFE
jgi:ABC-type glycerol-3-phosphate transport system substrate-binding protein